MFRSTATRFHQGLGIAETMFTPWIAVLAKRFAARVPFYTMGGISILTTALGLLLKETNGMKFLELLEEKSFNTSGKSQESLFGLNPCEETTSTDVTLNQLSLE